MASAWDLWQQDQGPSSSFAVQAGAKEDRSPQGEDVFDQIALEHAPEPRGALTSPQAPAPVVDSLGLDVRPSLTPPAWPPSAAVVPPPPASKFAASDPSSVGSPQASPSSRLQATTSPSVSLAELPPSVPPLQPLPPPLQPQPAFSGDGSTHPPHQGDTFRRSHSGITPTHGSEHLSTAARTPPDTAETHPPLAAPEGSRELDSNSGVESHAKDASTSRTADGPPAPAAGSLADSRTFVSLSGPPSGTAALLSEVVATGAHVGIQRGGSGEAAEWLRVPKSAQGEPPQATDVDGLKAEWLQVHTVGGEAPVATGGGVDALKAALRSARRAVDAEPAMASAMNPPSPRPERSSSHRPEASAEVPAEQKTSPPPQRRRGGLFGLLAGRGGAVDSPGNPPNVEAPVDAHAVATSVLKAAHAQAATASSGAVDTPGPPQVAAELLRLEGLRKQLAARADEAVAEAATLREGQGVLRAELVAAQEACSAAQEERDSAREHVVDTHRCLLRALQDVVLLRSSYSKVAQLDASPAAAPAAQCAKCEECLAKERARADALDRRLTEMLENSQKSEENAERSRVLSAQLELAEGQLRVARVAAAEAAGRARALRRELQALTEASQAHLGEYAALSDTLVAVSQARDTLKAEKRALEERLAASNSTTGIAEDVEGERAAHLEEALQGAFESRDQAEAALAVALQRQTELGKELEDALQRQAGLSKKLEAALSARGTPAHPAPAASCEASSLQQEGAAKLKARVEAESEARRVVQRLLVEHYGVHISEQWLQAQGIDTALLLPEDSAASEDGRGEGAAGHINGRLSESEVEEKAPGQEGIDGAGSGDRAAEAGDGEQPRGRMLRFFGL